MSEYTDYMALLTDAQTLDELRGALEEVVPWAVVDLPPGFPADVGSAAAEYAALEKPVWVTMAAPTGVGDLMSLGTAFNLLVEEDFKSWGMHLLCGGSAWNYAIRTEATFGDSILNREPPLTDPADDTAAVAAMAVCLGVEWEALTATLVPDGGQAFSALLGVPYRQMLDQSLVERPQLRSVVFSWEIED
jgi:hypothetical protein